MLKSRFIGHFYPSFHTVTNVKIELSFALNLLFGKQYSPDVLLPLFSLARVQNGQLFREAGCVKCVLQMMIYKEFRRMAQRLITQLILLDGMTPSLSIPFLLSPSSLIFSLLLSPFLFLHPLSPFPLPSLPPPFLPLSLPPHLSSSTPPPLSLRHHSLPSPLPSCICACNIVHYIYMWQSRVEIEPCIRCKF